MESDHILVAAGLTAAAVVGAFVLWGPPIGPGRHRGRLAGLVNLGQTCFLNTLLQALASCPTFIAWLEHDKHARETSLRATLTMVLSVINGTHSSVHGNKGGVFAPAAVISALRRLGWAIPSGEQDAHELLHVILSSLSEETIKYSKRSGSISDALAIEDYDSPDDDDSSHGGPWSIQSEAGDSMNISSTSTLSLCEAASPTDFSIASEPGDDAGGLIQRPRSLRWRSGLRRRHRWLSQSCRGLGLGGPPAHLTDHPFTGTLATQLKCTECGYKAAVRYDKFDSLSLPLPDNASAGAWGRHKLHRLLADFVAPEVVNDVACEGCNKGRELEGSPFRTKHIKIVYFGKLPACLCIHVARCTWTFGYGAGKRQDPVQFPERLSLAAYTYLQSQQHRRPPTQLFTSSSEGGSPLSSSMPNAWSGISESPREVRHLYQLQAVVVHTGNAQSGHFATYRRGPQPSHRKWYFASDIEIRESCIEEVLQSNAYMLFYQKFSQSDIY